MAVNILVGSRALHYHKQEFQISRNTDYDIITNDVNQVFYQPNSRFELHDINLLNNSYVLDYINDSDYIILDNRKVYVCNMLGLAIMKRSHLWRDLSFDSHITMYHKHLACYLENATEKDLVIMKTRQELTIKMFSRGHPSLKKTIKEFFDDSIEKKYDHDKLHELVAFYDKPIYSQLQKDQSTVWCHKDLWDKLSYIDKCKCVAEEVYVLAIERFLVPTNWSIAFKLAYIKSLRKVCTVTTSGWFRDFAIDNYPKIIELYDEKRIKSVQKNIQSLIT